MSASRIGAPWLFNQTHAHAGMLAFEAFLVAPFYNHPNTGYNQCRLSFVDHYSWSTSQHLTKHSV